MHELPIRPSAGRLARNERWAIAAILLVAALLRGGAILAFDPPLESDYRAYWLMATNAHDGRGLIYDGVWAHMSAGYPIFLAALFGAFGKGLLVAKLGNLALGLVATLLIYMTARNLFGGLAAAAAAILWAGYAETIVYTSYTAKENLTITLLALQIWLCTILLTGRHFLWAAAFLGASWGAMAVAGPSGLVVLPALVYAGVVAPVKWRQKLAAGAAFVLAAAVVLGPWLWRNNEILGAPVLNTNGGFNLYIGNNPDADGQFMSIEKTELGARWQALGAELGEVGRDRYAAARAHDHIREHPLRTLELGIKKLVLFWTPPWHDGRDGGRLEKLMRAGWLAEFLIMGALAMICLTSRHCRRNHGVVICLSFIALFTLVHGIYYVMPRYRLPIMLVVAVLAGGGVQRLLARYRLPGAMAWWKQAGTPEGLR